MAEWHRTHGGGIDPRLLDILAEARTRTGLPFEISSGIRTPEEQRKLLEQGYSTTMRSYHLPQQETSLAAAADLYLGGDFKSDEEILNAYRPIAEAAKQIAAEKGYDNFTWGGDWKSFFDPYHFQLGGKSNPAMSLSTKDAAMAPTMTPTAKPEEQQSLWGRLTGRSEATGLNPLQAFAAGLDALILPELRMGEAIRQQGAQRAKTAKEETQRNKSIEFLKSRADAGDDVAAKILGAVSTGALPVGTGVSTYLSQSLKQSTTTDTTDYKNYLEFKKTNPNVTFEEFYTKYKNKPDIQSKGVYRDKSGNIIGEVNYDASTGQFFQFDENGQRQTLNMKELTPVTDATFAKTIPSIKEFGDLSEKLQSDIGSMRQLEKYMTAINNTNEGFARLADDLAASAKTLLSSYLGADYASLAPEELNLRISRGLQQGLIGRFRLETVGGGVMTEQDALRIIQNLGGDVNLLQNKEVVAKQIENLFQAKKSSFERDKKRYDIALDQVYRSQGFEDIEPYKFNEDVFKLKSPVADQSKQTMTDDALLSGAAGKAGPALQQYLEGLSDADFTRLQELMKNGG